MKGAVLRDTSSESDMKRRTIIGVAIAVLVTVGMAAILWRSSPRTPMPVYQGKTAGQWLGEVFTNQTAALTAFRAMGTNAMPFIIQAFEKKDSILDRLCQWSYPRLPAGVRKHVSRPLEDKGRWSAANLVALNMPHEHDEIRAMVRLMATKNHPARLFVTAAAGWLKPEDADCVPMLIGCLRDTNAVVRWSATMGLGRIGPNAGAALPALATSLGEHVTNNGSDPLPCDICVEAAYAIWKISHETDAPARVCREALTSTDAATRGWALVYLSEIQPDDPSLMPMIMERLRHGGVFQLVAASQIGRFGPEAREAVPDLVKLAESSDWDLRQRARRSLKQIDPDAAAKYENK